MDKLPQRKSIRLKGWDYTNNGFYFVTICTQNHECFFGKIENGKMKLNDTGLMIDYWWQKIPNKFPGILLDKYQIMPNHIHMIINIVGAGSSRPINPSSRNNLGQIIAYLKYQSTKQINDLIAKTGHQSGAKTAPPT